MKFEEEIRKNQQEQREHIEKSIDFSLDNAFQDEIEKALNHKYFKREGTPGNYKYYYTEAEYKEAKGIKPDTHTKVNKTIINDFIDRVQPTIDEIVDKAEKSHNENSKNLSKFSKYDRELLDLTLKQDIVKSLAVYTEPTDKLKKFNINGSVSGQITIFAEIERDNKPHTLTTQVIYAGGHNIQRLHYRYLTSSTLPKKSSETESKIYTEKIKKLSKVEKIQEEIDLFENRFKTSVKKLNEAEKFLKLSDSDLIKYVTNSENFETKFDKESAETTDRYLKYLHQSFEEMSSKPGYSERLKMHGMDFLKTKESWDNYRKHKIEETNRGIVDGFKQKIRSLTLEVSNHKKSTDKAKQNLTKLLKEV